MYYKIKAIKRKKNGKYSVTAAESNVRPITYYTTEYSGTAADILRNVFTGDWHLNNTKNNVLYSQIESAIRDIIRNVFDANGIDLESQFTYGLDDRDKGIYEACRMYAERLESGIFSNSQAFGKELGEKLFSILETAQKNLADAKKKDKENGIIRISTASVSVFEGYDLLFEAEPTGRGPMLAPQEDYKPGVLQTDPDKIIWLGKQAEDLYAFLSFSGVDLTYKEYAERAPHKADVIRAKYERVVDVVENAWKQGARLRIGHTPFKGYPYIDEPSAV
ncbi:MAG: hypothetical protein J5966_00575 [Lachnospiraceae bacterium]|nr:hypothetical protein [Lachnospiraceae bacterium]